MDAHLFHDPCSMSFHGVQAQSEAGRDVFVRLTFRQHVVQLALALRESLIAIVHAMSLLLASMPFLENPGNQRAEVCLPRVYLLDGLDQALLHRIFENIPPGSATY